jgi:hypothetical protein
MFAQVVFESMFGNSERVARAVAEGLEEYGEVVVAEVGSTALGDVVDGVGLLVVGGPTHAFSMSRTSTREDAVSQGATQGAVGVGLRDWLRAVDDLDGLPCAAFDTRVSRVRRLPGSAAHVAARMLRRHHGHPVVPAMSFFVDGVAGPLAGSELDRARAWGRRVGAAVLADRARSSQVG